MVKANALQDSTSRYDREYEESVTQGVQARALVCSSRFQYCLSCHTTRCLLLLPFPPSCVPLDPVPASQARVHKRQGRLVAANAGGRGWLQVGQVTKLVARQLLGHGPVLHLACVRCGTRLGLACSLPLAALSSLPSPCQGQDTHLRGGHAPVRLKPWPMPARPQLRLLLMPQSHETLPM